MSGSSHEKEHVPICSPGGRGFAFPLFESEHLWGDALRGTLYCIALIYLFLGVNVVADKFVESIEVITSKKKRVRDKSSGRLVTVAVWNGTIANLTLLALGSSAPEILLSIVETVGSGFHAGALGPGTIVGSAAFNLFIIIAVCIVVIPSHESRKIEKNAVFAVTAVFSLLAYTWLVLIVQVISPDVVEIWEAVATLVFMGLLLVVSYKADIGSWPFGGQKVNTLESKRRDDVEARGHEIAPWQQESFNSGTWPQDAVCQSDLQQHDLGDTYYDPNVFMDEHGQPLGGQAGVLSFADDTWEVTAGFDQRWVTVPVFRYNSWQGPVCCKYRTEPHSAVPNFDYIETEGELQFASGVSEAEIYVQLLPKRLGEHSDQFRIVIEDAEGGAIFNPYCDGGAERCILTVTILNEHDMLTAQSCGLRLGRCCDAAFNLDSIRRGLADWRSDVVSAICDVTGDEDKEPSKLDWAVHLVSVPWKLLFSTFVPPPALLGGWPCFFMSLAQIGIMTVAVIDFAELFGCVAGIDDSITAITIVALGTSMPDLFASKSSAMEAEWADASIVNVTGSNSVNVFLGIGIPWTMASIYWATQGATEDWKARYSEYLGTPLEGGFIVKGGDLSFSVIVFTMAALVALAILRLRRTKLGGELGGPFIFKVLSACLLGLLWFFYIGLSVWKVVSKTTDLWDQIWAIFVAVAALENVLLFACAGLYFFRGSKRLPEKDVGFSGDSVGGELPALPPPLEAPPVSTTMHMGHPAHQEVLRTAGNHAVQVGDGARYPAHAMGTDVSMASAESVVAQAISFTGCAMVCFAANRLKRFASRRKGAEAAARTLQLTSRPPLPAPPSATLPRTPSFHSLASAPSMASGANPGGSSVGGRVVGWLGNHAADAVVLSAAGLAAAQLANRHLQ